MRFISKLRLVPLSLSFAKNWATFIGAISSIALSSVTGVAGDLDHYSYLLALNKDDKVCRAMEKVYNEDFSYPWRRPALSAARDDSSYGLDGRYAFPKVPGVAHDNRATFDMSYSRFPTSLEFEAIRWREGRYRFTSSPSLGDLPMLVAEFDIDNDGHTDLVIKSSFMRGFAPPQGSVPGGEETLLVFRKGEVDLTQPIAFGPFFRAQASAKPAVITALPGSPYRLIRPFVFESRNYLSAYKQILSTRGNVKKLEESMHVLRYLGVNINPGPIDQRNIVHLDHICEFRMKAIGQR